MGWDPPPVAGSPHALKSSLPPTPHEIYINDSIKKAGSQRKALQRTGCAPQGAFSPRRHGLRRLLRSVRGRSSPVSSTHPLRCRSARKRLAYCAAGLVTRQIGSVRFIGMDCTQVAADGHTLPTSFPHPPTSFPCSPTSFPRRRESRGSRPPLPHKNPRA